MSAAETPPRSSPTTSATPRRRARKIFCAPFKADSRLVTSDAPNDARNRVGTTGQLSRFEQPSMVVDLVDAP